MAGLTQEHKPRLLEQLVIGRELVVHVEVCRALVLLATELAGIVARREHILPEHPPLRGQSESLVALLYLFEVFFSSHTIIIDKM